MALYQLLCALLVVIILTLDGCRSLKQPECGRSRRKPRTVEGQDAVPGNRPWQVSLNTDEDTLCGGSLISDQWVLTAAHCIPYSYQLVTVFLGRHKQTGPNPHEVSRKIEEVICHPHYNDETYENDICLLKLSAPVTLTHYIYPVCLASEKSTFHTGTTSWVSGWGTTDNAQRGKHADILQEVNLPVVGNNECKCTYPDLTENMMCAGFRAGGKDACEGDSGGALVTQDGSRWVQGGIVSYGDGCGRPLSPGVYTRVSCYQEWISNHTGSSEAAFLTFSSPGIDADLNSTCPMSILAANLNANRAIVSRSKKWNSTTDFKPNKTDGRPYTTWDESVFSGGENVIRFSHFISLCVSVLSLYVLVEV